MDIKTYVYAWWVIGVLRKSGGPEDMCEKIGTGRVLV